MKKILYLCIISLFAISNLQADPANYKLAKDATAKKDYKKALDYLQKALEVDLSKNVSRPLHVDIARDYNNIGYMYQHLKKYKKALKNYYSALEILDEQIDKPYPKQHTIYYNNIASTYDALGEYMKAIEYYKKASLIYEKKLPEFHPYKATTYTDIANSYLKLNKKEKALKYYLKAFEIRRKGKLMPSHPDMIFSYYSVATLSAALGHDQDALKYYEELLHIYENTSNTDPKSIKEIKLKIDELQKRINKKKQGKKL